MRKLTGAFILFFVMALLAAAPARAQRAMENLGRGLVAVSTGGSNVFLTWRMLGTDPSNITFNLYRNGTKITASPVSLTNYTDNAGSTGAAYSVRPVIGGVEQGNYPAVTGTTWGQQYLTVNIQQPAGGTSPDGVAYTYEANDCSVGDLDGDGEYEIVLKWYPTNAKDNSQSGYTGNCILDAYKLNGTRLWRIDLGMNIRSGAHYTQFQVYDFDSDGKAELMCKTAPNSRDSSGNFLSMGPAASDNDSTDYRNSSGYVLSGPEYLTVFNGQTGREMSTINYNPPRGTVSSWGDNYGNRVDRFLAGVGYFDGQKPSALFCRGYYTRATLWAVDWRNGQLTQRWFFDSEVGGNTGYRGQGAHSLTIGDVDNDGKDEIIYGACAINDNGTGLYTTGLGHGDALHMSDMDPDRPGQEVWMVHEDPSSYGPTGLEFRDARTGALIWGKTGNNADVGRGLALNMDNAHRGFEAWGSQGAVYDVQSNQISTSKPTINFGVFWDGDRMSEILDSEVIDKWNGNGTNRLLTAYNFGAADNNGTKANPCLSGDILGDWREEVIWRHTDNQHLLIFTTTNTTNYRMYTWMHDTQYREAIAWQNTAYNQPPHTSFYVGEDMAAPPVPNIYLVGGGPTPTPGLPTATSTPTFTSTRTATPTPTPAGYQEIQLETACAMDGVFENTNAGWTGTGYANLDNVVGSTLTFSLLSTGSQTLTLSFRFANGSANARNMSLSVNGVQQVASVSFPSTGDFITWQTATAVVNLASGYNSLVLTSLIAEGAPNLDRVSWVSTMVSNGNCATPTPTRTSTPTFTATRTNTPSNTTTFTPTRTSTPTATATFTNTRTNTPTSTNSLTSTSTLTSTPTRTSTPSATSTFTATRTNTPIFTNTSTATSTSTSTHTSTNTLSPTASSTRTATPTFTSSSTPTATSTSTRTSTPTLSSTPTNTSTNTSTRTHTPTSSFTSTSTSTVTNTATSTHSFTATNTYTGTPQPTNSPTRTFTNTSTSTSTHTSTASTTPTPSATLTATLSATPTRTSTSTSTPTSTSTRTFTSTATSTATNTFTATNSFTGTPPPTSTPTRTFTNTSTSTSTHTSTASTTPTPSATLTATLSATPTRTSTSTPTPTSTSTRTFTSTATSTATNSSTATNTYTGTPQPTHTPTQTFTSTSTPTLSNTATRTSTSTSTSTSTASTTPTPSATLTATLSATPTRTSTSTSTPTSTSTRTFTSTATSTATSTSTRTFTQTSTSTFTITPTNTSSSTSTATTTVTATSTASRTPTSMPTMTATAGPGAVVYPNPASGPGPVTLQYSLSTPADEVKVQVFTTGFRKVNEITLSHVPAGVHQVPLELTDRWGTPLANGLYYIIVRVYHERLVVKLLVSR